MMGRRGALRALGLLGLGPLAMRGTGGTPPQPAGYVPPTLPGQAVGRSNVVRARLVIISGANGGIFIYSGRPGPGNPPILSLSDASSDPFENAIQPGAVSFTPGTGAYAQLFNNEVALSFGSGIPGTMFAAGAGNLAINSGSVSGDTSAQIQLESATASGVPNGEVFVLAGTLIIGAANVKLDSSASQQIPATRPSITALGSTWNATTASQANTNFNNILNFLTAIGVST